MRATGPIGPPLVASFAQLLAGAGVMFAGARRTAAVRSIARVGATFIAVRRAGLVGPIPRCRVGCTRGPAMLTVEVARAGAPLLSAWITRAAVIAPLEALFRAIGPRTARAVGISRAVAVRTVAVGPIACRGRAPIALARMRRPAFAVGRPCTRAGAEGALTRSAVTALVRTTVVAA